jgi:hypothetical protein
MVDEVNVNQISQCFVWLSAALYCFELSDYWEADFFGKRHRWYPEFLVVGRMDGISEIVIRTIKI